MTSFWDLFPIVLFTDSQGRPIQRYRYDPFGLLEAAKGNENNPYLFTGKEFDVTGLYYFGARYYDPAIGRFITTDPVVGALYNTQALNAYSYCYNNPLRYVDPTGEFAILPLIIAGLISSALYTVGSLAAGQQITLQGLLLSFAVGAISYGIGELAGSLGGWMGGQVSTGVQSVLGKGWFSNLLGQAIGRGMANALIDITMQYTFTGQVNWNRAWQVGVSSAAAYGIANFPAGKLGPIPIMGTNALYSKTIRHLPKFGQYAVTTTLTIFAQPIYNTIFHEGEGTLRDLSFRSTFAKYARLGDPDVWTGQGNIPGGFVDPGHILLGGIYGGITKTMNMSLSEGGIFASFYLFFFFEGIAEGKIDWEVGDIVSDMYGFGAGR
ncbi:MAG: RHS repeat-associated core domain-containing protein [Candidatus Edwardsbacteria bacterium]